MEKELKHQHRNISFSVWREGPGWKWHAYPPKAVGAIASGGAETQEKAVAACKQAIDYFADGTKNA